MWAMPRKSVKIRNCCLAKETKVMIAKGAHHSVTSRAPRIFFANSISAGGTIAGNSTVSIKRTILMSRHRVKEKSMIVMNCCKEIK